MCLLLLIGKLANVHSANRSYTLRITASPMLATRAAGWQRLGERAGVREEIRSAPTMAASQVSLTDASGRTAHGAASVGAELGALVEPANKAVAGIWLSGLVLFASGLLWLYRDLSRFLAALAPILVAFSSLVLGTPCITCRTGARIEDLVPAAMLGLAVALAALQWTGHPPSAAGRALATRWACPRSRSMPSSTRPSRVSAPGA